MLRQRLKGRLPVSHKYIKILKNFSGQTTFLWAVWSSVEFVTSEEEFQGTVVCYAYFFYLDKKIRLEYSCLIKKRKSPYEILLGISLKLI